MRIPFAPASPPVFCTPAGRLYLASIRLQNTYIRQGVEAAGLGGVGEVGLSRAVLQAGYNIASTQPEYAGLDFRKVSWEWFTCKGKRNPTFCCGPPGDALPWRLGQSPAGVSPLLNAAGHCSLRQSCSMLFPTSIDAPVVQMCFGSAG